MSAIDPILLSILIFLFAMLSWLYLQVRALGQRLQSLEKQHLALVEQLEERLYSGASS